MIIHAGIVLLVCTAAACGDAPADAPSAPETRADGTSVHAYCDQPAWSPDGSRIAFLHDSGGSPLPELHVVGVDGEGLVKLVGADEPPENSGNGDWYWPIRPRWSPDGAQIFFHASTRRDDPETPAADDWVMALYLLDVQAREVKPLKGDILPGVAGGWSPDGTRILYSTGGEMGGDEAFGDIWEITLASGEQRRLTRDEQEEVYPSWSPSGEQIVFVAEPPLGPAHPDFDTGVWLMNADGSGKRALLDTKENEERDPAWSPDGKTIALVTGPFTGDRIVLVPVEGGAPRPLVGGSTEMPAAKDPAWSPDGTKIAFCGQGVARFGLHVINADGTGLRGLAER